MGDSQRDHRLHPRVRVSLAVSYRTTGSFLVAYSVNLSKGGVFIEAPPLPVGTQVHLEIELPGAHRIGVDGTVAWVRGEADGQHPVGMGVRFGRDLDEAIGEHIDRLAAGFQGLEILVVAGSAEQRALLGRYIHGVLDCETVEADCRATAEVVLADGIDLAVIDLDTTGIDGMEVLMLARTGASPTPTIALANDPEGQQWARRRGVDQVLPAPPSFADLQAAMIAALARPVIKPPT